MDQYLATWGRAWADRIAVVPYESLVRRGAFPLAGTYIFSDLERLTPARLAIAARLWERIAEAAPSATVLNDPHATLRRYELLQALHAKGMNRFRVRRADESWADLHYPVFLRLENDHGGSRTTLLRDAKALERAVESMRWRRGSAAELLVTEFCDTSDAEGIFRKYAAFVVGEAIIPRHLLFSRQWMLKESALSEAAFVEEQRAYVRSNPHAEALRAICAEARINYGRVDYSLLDGRVQVWEINTNPTILREPGAYQRRKLGVHRLFARRIGDAWRTLDGADPARTIRLEAAPRLGSRLRAERVAEWTTRRSARVRRWLARVGNRVRGLRGGDRLSLLTDERA